VRILVLSKRQYSGKDLIDDRFGRLRELALGLAAQGHEVVGVCLSYRPRSEGLRVDREGQLAVGWHSLNLGRCLLPALYRYLRLLDGLASEFRPDLIWACSDAFHAVLGRLVGRRLSLPYVVDLYDNFESFRATRVSGITPVFRRAVRGADGVSCSSEPLARRVVHTLGFDGPVEVVQNAVRSDLFHPRDRDTCRGELGLPQGARIVGTAGALNRRRGVETLFRAFEQLAAQDDELYLAVAGPKGRGLRMPAHPRVRDLGVLPLAAVPRLLNALDVAVICNRDSAFGRYCFPQKLYEIVACDVPLVAARVGVMKELLAGCERCSYEPQNVGSLAEALRAQLAHPSLPSLSVPSWTDLSVTLGSLLQRVCRNEGLGACGVR